LQYHWLDYLPNTLATANRKNLTPNPPNIPAGMLLKTNPNPNPKNSPAGIKRVALLLSFLISSDILFFFKKICVL